MVAKVVEWHFQMNLINDNLFKSLESFKKYLVIIWSVKRYSKLLTFWYKGAILNDLPSARNLIMQIRHLGAISVENVILPVQGTGISIIKIRWSLGHLIFIMGFPYVDKLNLSLSPLCGKMVFPDSKVHGANMVPTWVLSAPDGPMLAPWTLLSGLCSLIFHCSGLQQWGCLPGAILWPVYTKTRMLLLQTWV